VSRISRALKQLARELEVPIICLCQVNREGGKDRGPILADLRDSGSIEQDADLVILLDDPSKRLDESGKTNYEEDNQESEDFSSVKARPLKVIIAKQRKGEVGTVELAWLPEFTKFANLERARKNTENG
jgi:replicative DNA helicase